MPSGDKRVFGQVNRRGYNRYQRQLGNKTYNKATSSEENELVIKRKEYRQKRKVEGDALDERFGFGRFMNNNSNDRKSRRGWIFNILPTTIVLSGKTSNPDSTSASIERSGLDLYFIERNGSTFKSTILHDPYFYIIAKTPSQTIPLHGNRVKDEEESSMFYENLISTLLRKYESLGLKSVERQRKTDLDRLNHLGESGARGISVLKLAFHTVQQLIDVRRDVHPLILRNQSREKESHKFQIAKAVSAKDNRQRGQVDPLSTLVDIREFDVPYLVRVCIDLNIRGGAWYTVTPHQNDCGVTLTEQDVETKANPKFLAFDIECTKAPLKFPDANVDSIFMISYMIEGQGYLILSRHIVGQDVIDFEYTPKPKYPGPFTIFNEQTEEDLIRRFLSEFQMFKPHIVVTYNGDFFDWPFLEQRAALYGLDLMHEIGIERVNGEGNGEGEYRGRTCVHMDAFNWVKRDSYLPQGAQGLKAVTKYKLGYDPVEVDPEDMIRYARERPIHMASYSVSDAVATYYLYETFVHMYIFSLCTIIPMGPEDVLRKGTGTLCEMLLMVQACGKSIICPNKQIEPLAKFHEGHLVESETYIGGKVECLEAGVFRSDIEYKFELKPSAFEGLIKNIDRDLAFAIEVEGGLDRNKVTNYDEIRCQIIEKLEMLRDRPNRTEKPYVYHLDVGAMYPNIILTNRLQPDSIVDDATCAACEFNQAKNDCKRKMEWTWRVDYNPATKGEYDRARDQLSQEKLPDGNSFNDLSEKEQTSLVSTRLKQYSKNAYNKTKVTKEITKTDTVCMRENSFYVDSVRRFRDRRYEYKKLAKKWGRKVKDSNDAISKKEAEDRALVYDSLQVAHKCILNSFYGYVMRKGARWRSMEMAGIVTKTGADLIVQARILVEQIGRPLELDTDGIWCILPHSFPDEFLFKFQDGSKFKLEYPCIMLNADVHDKFTNHQYQTLMDPGKRTYEARSECSIFFEVDGPYRCMLLPASMEEGRLLKKRYAVFNFDGSLAELKGFELKRRGELELIKTFQSQVFERFLNGVTLEDCYDSVAEIANHWVDILDTQGESLETDELINLISENRNMSRQLEEYGDQKGTSQTTARRLGEFLGAEIIKDKGLNCKFIIAELPHGAPVTDRAIPTAIWKAEAAVMKHHLRKWLKNPGMIADQFDIRNVLDWDYYRERLGKSIQKIITIPAALQKVPNPVPRIPHPEWLQKTVRKLSDRYQQQTITSIFSKDQNTKSTMKKTIAKKVTPLIGDIEDIGGVPNRQGRPVVHQRRISKTSQSAPTVYRITDPGPFTKVPLSKETFQKWLSVKKNIWNFREHRKRSRHDSSSRSVEKYLKSSSNELKKQRKSMGSMEGYIRDAALSLTNHEWHIIEIRELSFMENSPVVSSSGDFFVWILLGNGSLQKVRITVPRTVYINCKEEINENSSPQLTIKRVEKFLPRNKTSKYLYEVTLSEEMHRSQNWLQKICLPKSTDVIESFYEMKTSLLLRSILHLGCVCHVSSSSTGHSGTYHLSDLKRVDHPSEGKYLHKNISYKKVFLYERINAKSKSGIVALFILTNHSVHEENDEGFRMDSPRLLLSAPCHLWIVKPVGNISQKNISKKICEKMFSQLMLQILNSSEQDADSDYACLSPETQCNVKTLDFVDDDIGAFSGAHETLNGYSQANNGPTFLFANGTRTGTQLRKSVPSINSFPLIIVQSPPGIAHDPSTSLMPSLNWEPQAVQLCFESYLYTVAVYFPKLVACARFGKIPIGNLGPDAFSMTYDVTLSRLLQRNRALIWANEKPGCPDVGYGSLPLVPGSTIMHITGESSTDSKFLDTNDIWGDGRENISPVFCNPGAYRSICVEIDIHDLSIASVTASKGAIKGAVTSLGMQNDGALLSDLDGNGGSSSSGTPLGDEMSTAVSLPLLRSLAQTWLRQASELNNSVADQLLSNFYRLVSNPDSMMHDPAIQRVLLSLMKSSFQQLLGEFRRLGSTIIFATFNRIVVATSKTNLADAKEYIDFVISTIQKKIISDIERREGFTRLSLRLSNFYSDYLFLDEYNYGAILFENREPINEDEAELSFSLESPIDQDVSNLSIVPTVVSSWNMVYYLANETAQEYFRIVIGRFSKEIYRKKVLLEQALSKGKKQKTMQNINDVEDLYSTDGGLSIQLTKFKKTMISTQFSSYLTRAVSDIMKEGIGPVLQLLPGSYLSPTSLVLEFMKSVLVVLALDSDVEHEVQVMKKSLFSQVGIQEYSIEAKWQNPCASFMLPDIFCTVCQESRGIDLCILPPPNEEQIATWTCDECHTAYDSECIERRLLDIVEKKCIRYQLQDLRCTKTGRAAIRTLAYHSECSEKWKTDTSKDKVSSELQILQNLAKFYNLELLLETVNGLLNTYD